MVFSMLGSGGAALNFKVVGNPKPELPTENTIWVNTDTKITAFGIDSVRPEAAEEGYLWVKTGIQSEVEFNALKKNAIMVHPLAASQFIGGELVEKETQIWQDGQWKNWLDWSKWIVKGGLYKIPMIAEGVPFDPSYPETTFTVTQKDGYISFEQTTGTGMVLWGPVDLTDINTLTIEGDFSNGVNGSSANKFMLGVWGKFPPNQINTWESRILLTATGATLDVSAIQGERYVGFSVSGVGTETVTNFWRE